MAHLVVLGWQSLASGQQRGLQSSTGPAKPLRPIHLNLKRFEIPFSIDQVGQRPVEVHLYVSRDGGLQWELVAAEPVTGKHFLFTAATDGLYCFATRTVDELGNAHPSGPIRPQLTVNVDTTDPQVELDATVSAEGLISVSLVCTDASPSTDSLRLEYSIDQTRQWIPITDIDARVGPSDSGEPARVSASASFTPADPWNQVSIRVSAGDLAGNKAYLTRQIDKPRLASAPMRLATSRASVVGGSPESGEPMGNPYVNLGKIDGRDRVAQLAPRLPEVPPSPQAAQSPYQLGPYAGSPNSLASGPAPVGIAGPAGQSTPAVLQPSDPSPWAVPQFSVSSGAAPVPAPPAGAGLFQSPSANPLPGGLDSPDVELVGPLPPGQTPNSMPAELTPALPPPRPKTAAAAMRPLDSGTAAPSTVPMSTASVDPRQTAGRVADDAASPPSAYTAPQSNVANETAAPRTLDAFPAGSDLASLGVPIRYSRSRKFSLDYEVESAGMAGVGDVELWGTTDRGMTWKRWGADPDRESPFDIETNHDGAYGFRIVVVANNGLATPRPTENELPDIFVVADTVSPGLRITGAAYGEGNQTGSLIIRYQCEDEHLAPRPITLSFGQSQSGPWSTIAAGLANEGAYLWPADPNLPRQIWLRVDATDLAGNVASYILDTPIDIQGLAPRARIRGFNPLTGTPGATRPQAGGLEGGPSSSPPQTAASPSARFK